MIIPLLLLYSEYQACTLSIDLRKPGYETARIEYVLDTEYEENRI